jgi:regulator of replication initiation timing
VNDIVERLRDGRTGPGESAAEIEQLREALARAAAEIVRLRANGAAIIAENVRLGLALAKARAALRSIRDIPHDYGAETEEMRRITSAALRDSYAEEGDA